MLAPGDVRWALPSKHQFLHHFRLDVEVMAVDCWPRLASLRPTKVQIAVRPHHRVVAGEAAPGNTSANYGMFFFGGTGGSGRDCDEGRAEARPTNQAAPLLRRLRELVGDGEVSAEMLVLVGQVFRFVCIAQRDRESQSIGELLGPRD